MPPKKNHFVMKWAESRPSPLKKPKSFNFLNIFRMHTQCKRQTCFGRSSHKPASLRCTLHPSATRKTRDNNFTCHAISHFANIVFKEKRPKSKTAKTKKLKTVMAEVNRLYGEINTTKMPVTRTQLRIKKVNSSKNLFC